MSSAERWLALIDGQLRAIFDLLDGGLDVAPAQRLQLEGLTAAANADGIALDQLLQFVQRNAPQAFRARINAQGNGLQIDCWQRRAPVYPSTKD